jgi:hypothetical protein
MRIVGWCRENGLAYRSLVNEVLAEEVRTPRNKSKLIPGPRDALEKRGEFVQLVNNVPMWPHVSWVSSEPVGCHDLAQNFATLLDLSPIFVMSFCS